MDNVLVVQILQADEHTGHEKPCFLLIEPLPLTYMIPEIPSRHNLHDQVKCLAVLERVEDIYEEHVFELSQQILFVEY